MVEQEGVLKGNIHQTNGNWLKKISIIKFCSAKQFSSNCYLDC